jgi:hypothetical protein
MTCPLLIQPRAPFVLSTGHQLEMVRPNTRRQPAGVVRLVPGRDPPAVEDLPGDIMAAANLFADAHDRIAVFVDSALPTPAAGWRFDAVTDEFFPDGHGAKFGSAPDKPVPPRLSIRSVLRRPFDYREAEYNRFILPSSLQSQYVKMDSFNMEACCDVLEEEKGVKSFVGKFSDAAYTNAKLCVCLEPVKGVKLALRCSRDLPSARQDL